MKKILPILFIFFYQLVIAQNIGIGTATPTSKLNINGQVTIDQKNFGGFGGLLIKGGTSAANYPNITFSILNNALPQADVIAGYIGGNIISDVAGAESMDLVFNTTQTGLGGLTEKFKIKANGNIGIGLNPTYKLHVGNAANGLRIEGPASPGGTAMSIAGYGNVVIDKPGVVGGRLTILENGNTGIGENNPGFPINFASTLGDKISLYGNAGNHYGFGVQGGTLQIHAGVATDDIAFGTGSSAAFTERFRFKGNGAMAVGGNVGADGQVLTSKGAGTAPTWMYPIAHSASTGNTGPVLINGADIVLTALTRTITIPTGQNARLLVSLNASYFGNGCTGLGCNAYASLAVFLNGASITTHALDADDNIDAHISIANEALDVGAGTHIIEFKVTKLNSTINFYIFPTSSTVIALPQ